LIQIPRRAKQDIDVAAIFERKSAAKETDAHIHMRYNVPPLVRRMVLLAPNFLSFDFLNMTSEYTSELNTKRAKK